MVQIKQVGGGSRTGGGALAGLIASAVMLFAAMGWLSLAGLGFWTVPREVAAGVEGLPALLGGAGTVITGICLFLATGVILGIIYSWLALRIEAKKTSLLAGVVYSIGVWAVMTFAILPGLDPILRTRLALLMGTWFWWHLVYGAMLFMTPALRRGVAHRLEWQKPHVDLESPGPTDYHLGKAS
ncbi:MAG: hypothetical protein ACRD1Y_08835 [Terriglobales bacterium]